MTDSKTKTLAELYANNEDENKHAENVLLLAENFGTPKDVFLAQGLILDRDMGGRRTLEITVDSKPFDTYLWEKAPASFIDAYNATCPDEEEDES